MKKILNLFIFLSLLTLIFSAEEKKLTGTPISSESDITDSVFSSDLTEEFVSEKESGGWVGLKLSKPSIITKIGWAQKKENITSADYLLGIFEGANSETFYDAVPLFMITKEGKLGEMNYETVDVNLKFQYVRYVGPAKKFSVISGLEVYGLENEAIAMSSKFLRNLQEPTEAEGDVNYENVKMYQPTNIPLIVIHTENGKELAKKEDAFTSNLLIIDNGKVENKAVVKLKLRGNSTLQLLKKSYKWEFSEKTRVLDFPAKATKWSLLSNHQDRTLMRTLVAFKVSQIFKMKYTPVCKSVDLMINGEFKGNFNLCDQVEVMKGRVEITEMDETCTEEPEITGGYMIEIDGGGAYGSSDYRTAKRINYNIKYPEDITKDQLKYIQNKFNEIEADAYNNITDNIDLETFSKFFLIQEYCGNIDAVWSSYFITKERDDEKFYFGPVWDFDLSLDNDKRLYPTSQWDTFVFKMGTSSGTMRQFVIKLLSNPTLLQAIKDQWDNIQKNGLNKEVLIAFVDEKVKEIYESQKLNFIRWDIMNERVFLDKKPSGSFESEIDILKKYIEERFDILSAIIKDTTIENAGKNVHELRFDPYYGEGTNQNPWGGGNWGGNGGNWPGWDNNRNWTRPGGWGGGNWGGNGGIPGGNPPGDIPVPPGEEKKDN